MAKRIFPGDVIAVHQGATVVRHSISRHKASHVMVLSVEASSVTLLEEDGSTTATTMPWLIDEISRGWLVHEAWG